MIFSQKFYFKRIWFMRFLSRNMRRMIMLQMVQNQTSLGYNIHKNKNTLPRVNFNDFHL